MSLPKLNPVEPPWYGPVCPVVGEGWHREASPYPDHCQRKLILGIAEHAVQSRLTGAVMSGQKRGIRNRGW